MQDFKTRFVYATIQLKLDLIQLHFHFYTLNIIIMADMP